MAAAINVSIAAAIMRDGGSRGELGV